MGKRARGMIKGRVGALLPARLSTQRIGARALSHLLGSPNAMGMGGPCNAKSGITNTAMPEVALLASRARPWLPEGISSPPEGN